MAGLPGLVFVGLLGAAACGEERGALLVPEGPAAAPGQGAGATPGTSGATDVGGCPEAGSTGDPGAAGGLLMLTPGRVDFGAIRIGERAPPVTMKVTNRTGADAGALMLTATAAAFTIANVGCTGPLAPEATCTFDVAFRPPTPGPRTGWVTVASARGGRAATCLFGTGL